MSWFLPSCTSCLRRMDRVGCSQYSFSCALFPRTSVTLVACRPSDELMQSRFEMVEDDPFLTFVISLHPPPATSSPPTTSSPLVTSSQPTTPSSLLTTSSLPTTSTLSATNTLSTMSTLSATSTLSTMPTTPTPSSLLSTPSPPTTPSPSVLTQPAASPEPAPGSPVIFFVTHRTEACFPSLAAPTLPSGCGPTTSLVSPASISWVCKLFLRSEFPYNFTDLLPLAANARWHHSRRCQTTSSEKRSQSTRSPAFSSLLDSSLGSGENSRWRTSAVGMSYRRISRPCWHRWGSRMRTASAASA